MAKKVKAVVKIQIEGGKANPAPPVGTALGPHGINLMGFCKEYNAKTSDKMGQVIPVEVTVYGDGTFSLVLKTPPAAALLKKAAGVKKGSSIPQTDKVGKVTMAQCREIAEIKMVDLNAHDLDMAARIIAGTARSMGIDVID